jgi:hypothetical protein
LLFLFGTVLRSTNVEPELGLILNLIDFLSLSRPCPALPGRKTDRQTDRPRGEAVRQRKREREEGREATRYGEQQKTARQTEMEETDTSLSTFSTHMYVSKGSCCCLSFRGFLFE